MFKNKVWSSAAYTSYEKGGTTFDGILVIEKYTTSELTAR